MSTAAVFWASDMLKDRRLSHVQHRIFGVMAKISRSESDHVFFHSIMTLSEYSNCGHSSVERAITLFVDLNLLHITKVQPSKPSGNKSWPNRYRLNVPLRYLKAGYKATEGEAIFEDFDTQGSFNKSLYDERIDDQ